MRDFNFFSSFIETKKASVTKYIYIGLIATFIFLIVGGFSYINYSKAKVLEKEVMDLKDYLESKEVVEKLNEVEEKRRKLNIMKKYFSILQEINKNIDNTYVIDSELVEKIASTFPKELFVNNMTFSLSELNMQGVSTNRISIAELEHNLKELKVFDRVSVSAISKESLESTNYIFNMSCTFKDVNYDEDNK